MSAAANAGMCELNVLRRLWRVFIATVMTTDRLLDPLRLILLFDESVQLSGSVTSGHFNVASGNATIREKCVTCVAVMFDKSARVSVLIGVFSAQIQLPCLDAPSLHVWTRGKLGTVELSAYMKTFEKSLPAS